MVTSTTTRLSGVAGALAIKAPVRVATTANITLSSLQSIDGVTVVADDRVLVKNQTLASENGIYNASSGDWSRAKDFDGNRDIVQGTRVLVVAGSTQAVSEWYVTAANPITIDSSNITWAATSPLTALSTFAPGTEALPGLTPTTDPDSGLYRIGENNLGLSLGGSKVLDMGTAGLDITGTLDASGAVTLASTLSVAGASTLTGIVSHGSTSHEDLPSGTTAQRPGSPSAGNFRYNSTTGKPEFYNGTSWVSLDEPQNPRGWIDGLILSIGTDAQHDLDIAEGTCRDSSNSVDITLADITKQFDSTWVAGTGNGGLSSSLTALANNTWYHVFAVIVLGSADIIADTSVAGSNIITDHSATAIRRIGSVLTDGAANFIAFVQRGNEFLWVTPPLDLNVGSSGTTEFAVPLTVPPGVRVKAFINATGANRIYFHDPDVTDQAPSASASPLATIGDVSQSSIGGAFGIWTNTARQIEVRASADNLLRIATLGWTDTRGRNAP